MTGMNKFFLNDVRCFADENEFNIRPITFLVGENSTGKSTLLGCIQALNNSLEYRRGFGSDINFNSEPYQMGTFYDIVRRSNPKKKDFGLGFRYEIEGKQLELFLTLMEEDKRSEPAVSSVSWKFESGQITFLPTDKTSEAKPDTIIVQKEGDNQFVIGWPGDSFTIGGLLYDPQFLFIRLENTLFGKEHEEDQFDAVEKELFEFLEVQQDILNDLPFFNKSNVNSIAPVRSKPQRTYNPLKDKETPDGSEIPMTLMNLSLSRKKEWGSLRKRLVEFGKSSGLFSDIVVRPLGGRSSGDPFQLQIKVRGPKTNLMDVGYGVSQVLPILVRILNERRAQFLLQQPEVHLHPKGQAELASLLVDIYEKNKNSFVIETHGDYMIDRVRIEIMNGKIKADDVSLIYLEPVKNKVKVHNIRFDDQGNMIGVPDGYRDFFLRESDRLLGFS